MRSQTALNRELADKEAMLRRIREEERRNAVVTERSRMARELHDVLAHNLSVMIIQASGARRLLAGDPAAAIEAAGLIERTGREALVELRHVFGPIHHGEGESLEGSPGLAQLELLLRTLARVPAFRSSSSSRATPSISRPARTWRRTG